MLILDACHLASQYLCEPRCGDPWLFLEAETGSVGRNVWGNTGLDHSNLPSISFNALMISVDWQEIKLSLQILVHFGNTPDKLTRYH